MQYLHTLCVYFILCLVDINEAINCPAGWIGHDSSCYHFSHDTEPWMLAQSVCEGLGGHLAEIQTASEDQFVINTVKSLKAGIAFWIGGSDLIVEGEWRWWSSKRPLTYTNWYPGEPSNNDGKENCLVLRRMVKDGTITWNDQQCTQLSYYVCEKHTSTEIVG